MNLGKKVGVTAGTKEKRVLPHTNSLGVLCPILQGILV
jgi:hypothetical protein